MGKNPTIPEITSNDYQWAMGFLDERHGEGFAAKNPAVVIEVAKWIEMMRLTRTLKRMEKTLDKIDTSLLGVGS
jgi:hypothetical protein